MKNNIPWDLIIAKLRQNLSSEDEIEFNNWLGLEKNKNLFLQVEILWENIQTKTLKYVPDVDYYWEELSARLHDEKLKISNKKNPFQDRNRYVPIKRFYRFIAAASIFLLISFTSAYFIGKNKLNEQATFLTYSSLTGKSKMVLPDGTEVWLHSTTTLTYNSSITSDTREVNLQGEAYFNVTHNPSKPFIVNTNGVSIKVYGTKFNVNSNSSSNNILVSLVEGSVSMGKNGKNVILKPGEEGRFNKLNNTIEVSKGDVYYAKSWTNDQLRFENKSLRYVCHYLSKWYSVDIEIDPEMANDQSYTFTLRNEALEEIIRIISRISPIEYSFNEDNKLTLKQKPKTIVPMKQ